MENKVLTPRCQVKSSKNRNFLSRTQLRKQSADGYASFLEDPRFGWQWYLTLTFTEEIHPEQADKYFNRLITKINVQSFGKRFLRHGGGVTWVKGIEYQRRDVIHFHALISGLPESMTGVSNRFGAMFLWETRGEKCGFARIHPFKKGACDYLSKYVSKGGELDIHVCNRMKTSDLFGVL